MALMSINDAGVGFGGPLLLENINLQINKGERICVVGRNGTGKTTLLKLIAGQLDCQTGTIVKEPTLTTAILSQVLPSDNKKSVFEEIVSGLSHSFDLLSEYQDLSAQVEQKPDKHSLARLDSIEHQMHAAGIWRKFQRIESILSKLDLDGKWIFQSLSVGVKRRVLLAKALASEPDILLLDEPTNHLDIQRIEWLEEFLRRYEGTVMFVTHDRRFLEKTATRIVEIDRSRVRSWNCNYAAYIERREDILRAEAKENADFDKKLAEEEAWIRRGIQGRRTRNEGRVRKLIEMRDQRRQRRDIAGQVRMQVEEAERSGNLVAKADGLYFAYDENVVLRDFSTAIMRGDKVGLVGPNGAGKTTLLRILLGELKPETGNLKRGTNIQPAYFDQLHNQLDENSTVKDNITPGGDYLTIAGKRRHVMGYLQDFLFTAEKSRATVSRLSGGERNRLLLARLFAQPSNILVLDEPTNDLDTETLELLEDMLQEYSHTVLLVSHDRAFLDNVVTNTLVFEGDGKIVEYVGGYDDILKERNQKTPKTPPKKPTAKKDSRKKDSADRKKLGYMEKRELESLPEIIELLEEKLQEIHEIMSNPEFYKGSPADISAMKDKMETVQSDLAHKYDRWQELESLEK